MKYFTREWIQGELSDEDHAGAIARYWEYIDQIKMILPANLQILAANVNLHDGLFTSVLLNSRESLLQISFITGDLQVGYEDLILHYSDIDLELLNVGLLEELANSPDTEVLYDEVDVAGDGLYEHRLAFWPEGELAIRFNSLSIQRTPRSDRERRVPVTTCFVDPS